MSKWNTFTRRQEILSMLKTENSLSVAALSAFFDVSEVTIRSDLQVLAQLGKLIRTHGGAVPAEYAETARDFTQTIKENSEVKTDLARQAAAMVKDGDTVIIDSGSTMAILARMLHGKNITVLTNSLPVMQELSRDEGIELLIIGGSFRRSVQASVGEFSAEVLRSINADILFMGCTSFDVQKGITCPNLNERITKRLMIDASCTVCVVADHTKSNSTSLINVAQWNEIDCFVTDCINDEDNALLQSKGVKVLLLPLC